MAYLIQEPELKEATGYSQDAALERHLDEIGVWYGKGRDGRIYTTPAAFEAILRGRSDGEALFDAA